MTKEIKKLKQLIEFRASDSKIDMDEIKTNLNYLNDYNICRLLVEYLDQLLNENRCYLFFDQVVQLLLNGIDKIEEEAEKRELLTKVHEIYSSTLFRLRKSNLSLLTERDITIVKNSEKNIRVYIENMKYSDKVEKDKFDFIWFVLDELKALEFFRILIKKQSFYLNVCDEELNSLFFHSCRKYLETFDPYYLGVISLLLEHNDFILKNCELDRIKGLIEFKNMNAKNNYGIQRLQCILDHYIRIENIDIIRSNSVNALLSNLKTDKSPYFENLDRIDYFDRTDLSHLDTICFKRESGREKDVSEVAYSIVRNEDSLDVYYHIIDLPEYITLNGQMEERASHQNEFFKTKSMGIPLFDQEYLSKYVLFRDDQMRFAITIKVTLNKKNRPTNIEVSESVISVNKSYSTKMAEVFLERKSDETLTELAKLADGLKAQRKDESKDPLIVSIQKEMSILANSSMANLAFTTKKPLIYKNFVSPEDMKSVEVFSEFTKFSRKVWDKRTSLRVEKMFASQQEARIIYSGHYIGHEYFRTPYCTVTKPTKKYVALENLRIIKELIVNPNATDEEIRFWKSRIEKDVMVANSTSIQEMHDDMEVKRLLQKQKESGRIGL